MKHPREISARSRNLIAEIGLVLTSHLGEETIVMPDEPPLSSLVARTGNGNQARGIAVERCAPTIWSIGTRAA